MSSIAIGLTVVFVVLFPHSKWLGWIGLIDLALIVAGVPWMRRRSPKTKTLWEQ
jgi:hypothetical protein